MLPDKFLQEGKEINFLTYSSDGQPNWFGKPHATTFIWLMPQGHKSWQRAEGWGGPVPTLTGNHLLYSCGDSSLVCCCCCLPCEEDWDSSQGTPVVGKQVLGPEGRVQLFGWSASFIRLDGKEWPLWSVTRADLAGKIHSQDNSSLEPFSFKSMEIIIIHFPHRCYAEFLLSCWSLFLSPANPGLSQTTQENHLEHSI